MSASNRSGRSGQSTGAFPRGNMAPEGKGAFPSQAQLRVSSPGGRSRLSPTPSPHHRRSRPGRSGAARVGAVRRRVPHPGRQPPDRGGWQAAAADAGAGLRLSGPVARLGNLVAILAGDYLLARASELAASLGGEVSRLLAATIGSLCEGQVSELQQVFDVRRSEDDYLSAISRKTAALMSASCRIGALTAGLDTARVDALTEYGRRLGMAFQIVDDVLDVVASEEQLGKPAGNDLVEGV